MSILDRFTMAKMTIHPADKYQKSDIKAPVKSVKSAFANLKDEHFTAMFNPDTYKITYENEFSPEQGIFTSGVAHQFTQAAAEVLEFDLIIDMSPVHNEAAALGLDILAAPISAIRSKKFPTAQTRVEEFLHMCYEVVDATHEPRTVVLKWGTFEMFCKLIKVEVEYTLFNRLGIPTRAILVTEWEKTNVEDNDEVKKTNSPDLTRRRIIRAGETLPLLAEEFYGSKNFIFQVAKVNKITNIRNIPPGIELIFPPIEN